MTTTKTVTIAEYRAAVAHLIGKRVRCWFKTGRYHSGNLAGIASIEDEPESHFSHPFGPSLVIRGPQGQFYAAFPVAVWETVTTDPADGGVRLDCKEGKQAFPGCPPIPATDLPLWVEIVAEP